MSDIGRAEPLGHNPLEAELAGMADNDVASLSDVFIQLHGPGGFADQLGKSPPCAEILYSVYSRDAERCWGRLHVGNVLMDRNRRRLRGRLRRWPPRPVVGEGAMIDKHTTPLSASVRGGQAPEKSAIFR